MTDLYNYKSKAPELLKVVKTYFDKRNAVMKAGFEFAYLFGKSEDVKVYFMDRPKFEFAGMVWVNDKQPEHPELWTKPLPDGRRYPKKTGGGDEGRILRARWHEYYPKGHVDHREILTTINCPMDTFFQTPGVVLGKGIVYIQTTKPATAHVTEITTSQWNKATSEILEQQNAK